MNSSTIGIDPYAEEDECMPCEEHGVPCLRCAHDLNGVNGPGFYKKQRLLLPADTHPNVFRSMVYWMNQHPTEIVGIRLAPFTDNIAENLTDVNIASLGLLGRTYVPTLSTRFNKETLFIPMAPGKSNDI